MNKIVCMAILVFSRPNPFDVRTVLLAKHAQHVVLIHFPIALFLTAVLFDVIAYWTKRRVLADVAYYNLLVAALATIPVIVTGVLAWQWQLEGQRLKGNLLLHLVLGAVSAALIWLLWWLRFRARRTTNEPAAYLLLIEAATAILVMATAHLGGFLSGVNASN